MPILDAVRRLLAALKKRAAAERAAQSFDVPAYLQELFAAFPFSEGAQRWLKAKVRVEVIDPHSTSGAGGWFPGQYLVRLRTIQYEAAIHELAHALWHEPRQDRAIRDGLVAAVQRLAEDPDPRWARVHVLARHYVYGIADQPGFERGLLLPPEQWGTGGGPRGEWDDQEMYAGLASGCMADIRLLPPYLRAYYRASFQELAADAPSSAQMAKHG